MYFSYTENSFLEKKNKPKSRLILEAWNSLFGRSSLIPFSHWGLVVRPESSPGNNKQALPPWCTCALKWRQLRGAECLLLHRFLVSSSHLMTFFFPLQFNSWSHSQAFSEGRGQTTCGGRYFDVGVPVEECKGFNERRLKEKGGFENSPVPKHPTQLP